LPQNAQEKPELFDILGRRIKTLIDEQKSAGYHTFKCEAGNLASGVYYYQLVAGDFREVKKMILLK
jgi:hypothetical protein